MKFHSVFDKQLSEAITKNVFFIERNLGQVDRCVTISVWKIGGLAETHKYIGKDKHLPIFERKVKN